jgi:diguanylate cyclase (GGDEF)-like protein
VNASRRILVVDDEPDTERMLRVWYDGQPVAIFAAPDGEEGLRAAARVRPDVILLDVTMPVLDGLATARRLKADPATSGIPLILLTARRDKETKLEAFGAGADDYITKPFVVEEVDARITAMLRKRDLYVVLEERNRELEELLVVDEKTGLANYRAFQKKLREEWLRSERYRTPLSLVMLDLDDFKLLNDTLGHPAGDRALREVATLVAGGARATDLAARFGGEEFSILLPHTELDMAVRVAERILAAVREHRFLQDEHPSRLTASAGVATVPSSPLLDTPEDLVQAADEALYRAKARGKNQVAVHGVTNGAEGRRTRG